MQIMLQDKIAGYSQSPYCPLIINPVWSPFPNCVGKCLLSNDIYDYHIVSQGKTTIPSVDDNEEMQITDVRIHQQYHMRAIIPI